MECRSLKQIVDLICSQPNSAYKSYTAVADRLQMSDTTLRGYWAADKFEGRIPDKNIAIFCEFIQEVIPSEISQATAKNLLTGSPINFHNALLPISGIAWSSLIERLNPLGVTVKPVPVLGFGESDDTPIPVPLATAKIGQKFYFHGKVPWSGEAVVFAEHGDVWHIIKFNDNQRVFSVKPGGFAFPPCDGDRQVCLEENSDSGFYRYFVIAQSGKLDTNLRGLLNQVNPYAQLSLDMIGDIFNSFDDNTLSVFGTTLRIEV